MVGEGKGWLYSLHLEWYGGVRQDWIAHQKRFHPSHPTYTVLPRGRKTGMFVWCLVTVIPAALQEFDKGWEIHVGNLKGVCLLFIYSSLGTIFGTYENGLYRRTWVAEEDDAPNYKVARCDGQPKNISLGAEKHGL